MPPALSKSRIMSARQCARRVWLEHNRPELAAMDPGSQRRIEQGHELNTIVRRLYPAARPIEPGLAMAEALLQTESYLRTNRVEGLLEGAFGAHGVAVRTDLVQVDSAGLRLTEVKASTRVKPYHIVDTAIQHWVMQEGGWTVSASCVAHIDKRFRYPGHGQFDGLLRHVDVSEQVAELLPLVPGWIAQAKRALAFEREPLIQVGDHCLDPRSCPFLDHCRGAEPDYPVRRLPGGGRIVQELLTDGIDDMRAVPPDRVHKPLQKRVIEATRQGIAICDPALGAQLRALPYPRYFLDFESIQFAVPRWPGTRPFEDIPFQWSCHIEQADGQLTQHEFLDQSGGLPILACAEALLAACGDEGPILTYSHFEHSVIGRLAARLPDLEADLHNLRERLFDLLPLVRQHYYHPDMRGSFSIKAVLPTLAPDLDYSALDRVQDGIGAQIAYEKLINPSIGSDTRAQIVADLLAYCRLDTLAMVRMVHFFSATASDHTFGGT